MSISEKQLAANRANAQKSTGPKTEEGKARSSMNGFQSMITSLTTVMTDEDRVAQTEFVREYVEALDPQGIVEQRLAINLAHDNWRLLRIKTVEENIFAYGLALPLKVFTNDMVEIENAIGHAYTYLRNSDKINRLSLYEMRLNRIINMNLDLLMRLKAERRKNQPAEGPGLVHKAKAAGLQNESVNRKNGFASANPKPTPEAPPTDLKIAA